MSNSEENLGWWQTLKSVGAAFFGVQSSAHHKQDFSKGKPLQFILVGLFAVILFVMGLVLAVSLVISA